MIAIMVTYFYQPTMAIIYIICGYSILRNTGRVDRRTRATFLEVASHHSGKCKIVIQCAEKLLEPSVDDSQQYY